MAYTKLPGSKPVISVIARETFLLFAQKRTSGNEFRTQGPSDLKLALCQFGIQVMEATFIHPTFKNGWMLVLRNKPNKETSALIDAWNSNLDMAKFVMIREAPLEVADATRWNNETFIFKLSTIAAPEELELNNVMDELAAQGIMPAKYPVLSLVHLKEQPGRMLLTILGRANARALCESESFVAATTNGSYTLISIETPLPTISSIFGGCRLISSTGWSRGSTSATSVKEALTQLADQLGEGFAAIAAPEFVHIVIRDHSPTGQVLIFYEPSTAADSLVGQTLECNGSSIKFEITIKEEKGVSKPAPSSPKKSPAQGQLAPRLAKKPAARVTPLSWAQRAQNHIVVKQEVTKVPNAPPPQTAHIASKMEEDSVSDRVMKIEESMSQLARDLNANGLELRTVQAGLKDILQLLQKQATAENGASKRSKVGDEKSEGSA